MAESLFEKTKANLAKVIKCLGIDAVLGERRLLWPGMRLETFARLPSCES